MIMTINEIEQRLLKLEDHLNNGIILDENTNEFKLVWTERDLKEAKIKTKELSDSLKEIKEKEDE